MLPFQNAAVFLFFALAGLAFFKKRGKLADILCVKKYFTHYLAAVLGVSFLVRAATVGVLSTRSDEGFFVYCAWLVSEGFSPFTDFVFTQQPLYLYVTSAVFDVLGVGVVQAKLVPFLASFGSVLLAYRIGERFYGRVHGLGSAALMGLSHYVVSYTVAANAYPEMLFLNMAAVYVFLERRWMFLVGVLAGLAGLYKMLGVLVLAPIIVSLLLGKRYRDSAIVLAGAVLVLGAAAHLMWSPEYVYQVFMDHGLYENSGLFCKLWEFVKVLAGDPVLVLAGLVGAFHAARKPSDVDRFFLLYLGFSVSSVFVFRYVCGFSHPYLYFTLAYPALSVLGGRCMNLKTRYAGALLFAAVLVSLFTFYVYFVSQTYSHQLVSTLSDYVGEHTAEGDQVVGMSYLACPVAFNNRLIIEGELVEFFGLRLGVEDYSAADYRRLTCGTKYALMYAQVKGFEEFWQFLREYGKIEKVYGNIQPVAVINITEKGC